MPIDRKVLEALIAKWRAEVNPAMHYAAQQLEDAIDERVDG